MGHCSCFWITCMCGIWCFDGVGIKEAAENTWICAFAESACLSPSIGGSQCTETDGEGCGEPEMPLLLYESLWTKRLYRVWAESELANIPRLSEHCPAKSDWLHTSNCAHAHLCISMCVCPTEGDETAGIARRLWGDSGGAHRSTWLWYNWKSAVKDARLKVLEEAAWW